MIIQADASRFIRRDENDQLQLIEIPHSHIDWFLWLLCSSSFQIARRHSLKTNAF